jgi:hypothetical protein
MIPPLQYETWIIDNVIKVEMREEGVRDINWIMASLQQAMCGSRAVIEHDLVATNLQQVTGAHAPCRRCRCPSTKERESHQFNLLRLADSDPR